MDWQSGIGVLGLGVTLVTSTVALMWPTIPRRILLIFLMVGICLMLVWPMSAMIGWLDPEPIDDKKANTTSNTKPHVAMIPRLEIVLGTGAAIVGYYNRTPEDVHNLTVKTIINIDGKDMIEKIPGESGKEFPILLANGKREFSTYLDRGTYHEVMVGKLTLKIMSSVSYSFHGTPYTESCVTKWNALVNQFDYIDC